MAATNLVRLTCLNAGCAPKVIAQKLPSAMTAWSRNQEVLEEQKIFI
jgi:hypothetical protein